MNLPLKIMCEDMLIIHQVSFISYLGKIVFSAKNSDQACRGLGVKNSLDLKPTSDEDTSVGYT